MSEIKNKQILVIDDESFILSVTVAILGRLGCTNVDTAENGEIGIEKLNDKDGSSYDLVICDLNMPVLDGVGFIRQAGNCNFSGALIISTGEESELLQQALELASSLNLNLLGSLSKPPNLGQLESMLGRLN